MKIENIDDQAKRRQKEKKINEKCYLHFQKPNSNVMGLNPTMPINTLNENEKKQFNQNTKVVRLDFKIRKQKKTTCCL